MRYRSKCVLFVLVFILFSFSLYSNAWAKSSTLVLEWEQHWETYGLGGTCNYGTHNFFVGDVDDDGVIEMVTGGFTYDTAHYTFVEVKAPLGIWNWTGENFTRARRHLRNWECETIRTGSFGKYLSLP